MGVALVGGMLFATPAGHLRLPCVVLFRREDPAASNSAANVKKRRKHNENEIYDHRRRRDAGRLHPEILSAAGRHARKLSLRRGVLAGHDGRGRTLVGTFRRHDAQRLRRTGAGQQPRRGRGRRTGRRGPGQPPDRAGAIPAADRHRCLGRGRIHPPKPRSCSRMPSSRPSRGSCRFSEPCATPNCAAKAEIASTEWALAGVRLSLAAEVATTYFTLLEYERDLFDRPSDPPAAARIGRADRLDVPLRHVRRRGAGAGGVWPTPPRPTFRNTAAPWSRRGFRWAYC